MDIQKDFKTAVTNVKLLMSSLFARKQPKMILSYMQPNVFYFTNIESSRLDLYKAKPEDILSKVEVINQELMDTWHSAFPCFDDICCEVDVSAFGSALNKALKTEKDKFPEVVVVKDRLELHMVYKDDSGNTVTNCVGVLIPGWNVEFYEEILTKFEKFSPNVIRRKFKYDGYQAESKVSLQIVEVSGSNGQSEFGLPVSDGLTMVSSREYVRKRGLEPVYDLLLQFDEMTHTSKATIQYVDDWVNARTIMPGSLWFMTRKVR